VTEGVKLDDDRFVSVFEARCPGVFQVDDARARHDPIRAHHRFDGHWAWLIDDDLERRIGACHAESRCYLGVVRRGRPDGGEA
jgi:hypothetical protein